MIGFMIGLITGGFIGVMSLALCVAAKDADITAGYDS